MDTLGLVNESQPVGAMLPIRNKKPRQAQTPPGFKSLYDYLYSTATKFINFDPAAKRERHHQMFLTQEFWQSRQYGFFEGDNWLNPDPNRDGIYYQCDYFSEQVLAQLSQWCGTQIELIVTPDENSSEGLLASRAASDLLGYYTRRIDTPVFDQIIGLDAILKGTYFMYQYYDPESTDEGTTQIPRYGTKDIPNPNQRYICASQSCGYSDNLSTIQSAQPSLPPAAEQNEQPYDCPMCGGPIEIIGPPTMAQYYVEGYEEVPLGTIRSKRIDGIEVDLHPSCRGADIETSPYLIHECRMMKSVVQDTFWYLQNISGESPRKQQRYQRTLERQVGSFTGTGTQNSAGTGNSYQDDMVNVTKVWLDRSVYAPYVFENEETFENGLVVPANTPLRQVFPNGIYLCLVNNQIADIRDENKNDHWVGGVYKVVPGAAWGIGVQSALWQQRLLNDMYNMGVEWIRHLAAPQRLYDADVMDGGMFSGNPKNLIPVENRGPDKKLSDLIHVEPPPQGGQAISGFIAQARSDMQAGTNTNNFLLGNSTPNASATDARQSKDQAIQKSGLPIKIKAHVYAKRGEQIVKLARKHYILERTLPIFNDFQKIELKKFSSIDIDRRLFVTFAEHSTVIRNAGDKRADVLNAEAAGVWDQTKPPKLRKMLAGVFQVPFYADEMGQMMRIAEARFMIIQREIMKFRSFMQQDPQTAQQLLTPIPGDQRQTPMIIPQILAKAPVELEFDDHDNMQMWIRDWYNSDRGDVDTDPLLRLAMKTRFHEHRDAALEVGQSQSADAALANAPQVQAAAMAGQQLGGAALPVKKHLDPQGSLVPQQ